jgi:hypothetical protein
MHRFGQIRTRANNLLVVNFCLLHGFLVFALTLDLSTDQGKENVVLASLTPSARTVA